LRIVKNLLLGLVYTATLVTGLAIYAFWRKTPAFGYQGMIKLFCLTRGRSNDLLSSLIGNLRPPHRIETANGVLGDVSDDDLRHSIVTSLRNRGYYIFKKCLPAEICDRLLSYATSQPCEISPMDGLTSDGPHEAVYRRRDPQAIRYVFRTHDLLRNSDIQKLLADMSFPAIAQDYLGARPLIDVLSMWWFTDYSDRPDSRAAQYYHFDMDRPKWLKFFIYLTDVEATSGPHIFVAGSHKSGVIPSSLLSKGYARLKDEEVEQAFDKQDIIEFTGPRGTIIAEDTRGLHKGRHVMKGDRLMLQIQFSNSLFGGDYPKSSFDGPIIPDLREKLNSFRRLYSAYL
jgi:hypothetical protein